jgi:ATP-dependent RNA helicase RhlE
MQAIVEEGYTIPTPIQAKGIPPALEGRDILGCAQTGTGKTAAFALPILHRLLTAPADNARRGAATPRALILSPTRELASQIADSFAAYGRHTALSHTSVYGGVSQVHQVRALRRGVDILVATPGRLMDLMEQRLVDLSGVTILVLDEADRMLDMGFIQPIRRIASALPAGRQTMLFSATMPREIMHLADSLMRNPVKVAVTPVASLAPMVAQSVYMVPRMRKQALLEHLLAQTGVDRAVVFTKTKHGADKVARRLHLAGISSQAIHGNKAQNQRQRALDAFRRGRSRVLVATDVAARGLDVDGITHVFNFDLPMEPEGYVHRIGRTGRAGATGIAISFCDHEERSQLRDIERLTGTKFAPITTLPVLPELPPLPPLPQDREGGASEGSRDQDQARDYSRDRRGGFHATAGRSRRPQGAGQGGRGGQGGQGGQGGYGGPSGRPARGPGGASRPHAPTDHAGSGGHAAGSRPQGQAGNRTDGQSQSRRPNPRSGRHPLSRKFKA